eukprot:2588368-Prymnesium_polylepis.3
MSDHGVDVEDIPLVLSGQAEAFLPPAKDVFARLAKRNARPEPKPLPTDETMRSTHAGRNISSRA